MQIRRAVMDTPAPSNIECLPEDAVVVLLGLLGPRSIVNLRRVSRWASEHCRAYVKGPAYPLSLVRGSMKAFRDQLDDDGYMRAVMEAVVGYPGPPETWSETQMARWLFQAALRLRRWAAAPFALAWCVGYERDARQNGVRVDHRALLEAMRPDALIRLRDMAVEKQWKAGIAAADITLTILRAIGSLEEHTRVLGPGSEFIARDACSTAASFAAMLKSSEECAELSRDDRFDDIALKVALATAIDRESRSISVCPLADQKTVASRMGELIYAATDLDDWTTRSNAPALFR